MATETSPARSPDLPGGRQADASPLALGDFPVLDQARQVRATRRQFDTFCQRVREFTGLIDDEVRRRVLEGYAARQTALDVELFALAARVRADQDTFRVIFENISAAQRAACLDLEELDLRQAVGELTAAEHAERTPPIRQAISEHADRLETLEALRRSFAGPIGPNLDREAYARTSGERTAKPAPPAAATSAAALESDGAADDRDDRTLLVARPAAPANDGDRTMAIPRAALVGDAGAAVDTYPLGFLNDIGRSAANHIRFDVPSVSRRHARITLTSQGFTIEDCGSGNATVVNGTATDRAALKNGDRIQIGEVQLTFYLPWPPAGGGR